MFINTICKLSIIAISPIVVCYCILIWYPCMLIFTKVCFTCSVNCLTLWLLDSLHIWIRVILQFISLLWLQRLLVFVGSIYAIYLFLSLLHCTGAGSSLWRSYHRWLHWRVSFWQLALQPVSASIKGAVRVTTFLFQWTSKDNSDSGVMCAGRDHVNLIVTSLCHAVLIVLFCMLLSFCVILVYLMLFISDNSSCGYCYLLTVPDVR